MFTHFENIIKIVEWNDSLIRIREEKIDGGKKGEDSEGNWIGGFGAKMLNGK